MKSFTDGKKWYVAYLLFAQEIKIDGDRFKCESCDVLFEASSAVEVYNKALVWAEEHATDNLFKFLGVEHIHEIGDERPMDGTEIGGRFFDEENVWERRNEIIPQKHELRAVVLEMNKDTPVGELMTDKQKQDLKEGFGEN